MNEWIFQKMAKAYTSFFVQPVYVNLHEFLVEGQIVTGQQKVSRYSIRPQAKLWEQIVFKKKTNFPPL